MIPSAFWFLMRRSARNRVISQVNRLKEPRYAIALLVGFAYLWFFLFGQPTQPGRSNPQVVTLIPLLGSLLLFLAVARWWAFGGDRRALSFTSAEIQFLFPAPIERKALIQWKLLRWQLLIIVNVLIWMVLARRARPPIPLLLNVISLWTLFSTLSLHRLGSALTKAGVAAHWRTGLRRQAVPIALVLLATGSLLLVVARHWGQLSERCCGAEFWPLLDATLREPGAAIVLFPFRLLTAPVGALTVAAWLSAILPALGLLALHYFWVVRSQVAFEEAAVRASAETADRLARFKGRKRAVPRKAGWSLPLKSTGWTGTAIVWKNSLALGRGAFSRSLLVGLMIMAAGFAGVMGTEHGYSVSVAVGTTCLAVAGVLSFIGPNWIRNDLRSDMAHLALLRSYPLSGRTLVLGQIMSSTLALTGIQVLLLGGAYWGLTGTVGWGRFASVGNLLLVVPLALVVNAIGMTIQNAGAVLFPAWVRFDAVRPGGFETLGQNILSSLLTVFLSLIALAAPALTGWFLYTRLLPALGAWTFVPVVAGVGLIGAFELGGLISWLGRVFERTESIT